MWTDPPAEDELQHAVGRDQAAGASAGERLSVIVRFHDPQRLPFLEEAILSLSIQDWPSLDTIIVLQNGDVEMERIVRDICSRQPWLTDAHLQILTVSVGPGVDGRSALLNEGLLHAQGRFLAFLDDDDVVYQHGYSTLIRQLLAGDKAVAVGGYREACLRRANNQWFVQAIRLPHARVRSRLGIFLSNFIPIHSYVIDRSRLGDFALYFDEAFPPLEDYDFLLRLCARFEPDLSQLHVPVCEYRIHGTNSVATWPDAPANTSAALRRAQQLIDARKQELVCELRVSELAELARVLAEHEQTLHRLARRGHGFMDQHATLKARLRALLPASWRARLQRKGLIT